LITSVPEQKLSLFPWLEESRVRFPVRSAEMSRSNGVPTGAPFTCVRTGETSTP
jgi:hypothetical protein